MNSLSSATIASFNALPTDEAVAEVVSICGSRAWALALAAQRPYASEAALSQAADEIWWSLTVEDWHEAFRCHPRIGERKAVHASQQSTAWSTEEQAKAAEANAAVLDAMAEGNRAYERQFGFTYIVCATGKSAEEMLAILQRRLANDRATELREAAEQQRQITQIRIGKWLAQ